MDGPFQDDGARRRGQGDSVGHVGSLHLRPAQTQGRRPGPGAHFSIAMLPGLLGQILGQGLIVVVVQGLDLYLVAPGPQGPDRFRIPPGTVEDQVVVDAVVAVQSFGDVYVPRGKSLGLPLAPEIPDKCPQPPDGGVPVLRGDLPPGR